MTISYETRSTIASLPGKSVRPWKQGDARCHCTHCALCGELFRTVDLATHEAECQAALVAALERDRVVGVLDAWVASTLKREGCGGIRFASWQIVSDNKGVIACELTYEEWSGEDDGHWVDKVGTFEGETADQARTKAAKAISEGWVE